MYFSLSCKNLQDKLQLYMENNKDLIKIFCVDNLKFWSFSLKKYITGKTHRRVI